MIISFPAVFAIVGSIMVADGKRIDTPTYAFFSTRLPSPAAAWTSPHVSLSVITDEIILVDPT